MTTPTKYRIESIDIIRGLAMVIMALDHTRDYVHFSANLDDPLNLATTTPALFITRWITHFCAPIFIFLSGTSVYLQSRRKTKNELGTFLIQRGLWLIFLEWFVVSLGWTFNPMYNFFPFQVIWAIGISMVFMGIFVLLRFSDTLIFIVGAVIVAGHNLLDIPEAAPDFQPGFWWDLLHSGIFKLYPINDTHFAMLVYPFPAWTGVMMLGYCIGKFFTPDFSPEKRRVLLSRIGLGLIVLFIAVRLLNGYGDPTNWSVQKNGWYTVFSFISVTKYPPSLLYLCITIGPALLLLAAAEHWKNKFSDVLVIFGRTALSYYVIHIYLIHLIGAIIFFMNGHTFEDATKIGKQFPFLFSVPGEGYGLGITYLVWVIVVILLYPFCRWFNSYKAVHRDRWWLSYL